MNPAGFHDKNGFLKYFFKLESAKKHLRKLFS